MHLSPRLRALLPLLPLAAALAFGGATPASSAGADGHDVRIRRDSWGVPHVLGRTDADAAYGLGYAQSEDDWATLQESLFASRGKLALLNGASGVPSDTLFQLLDIDKLVRERYEVDLPADTRAVVEAYAAGVNRWAAQHPDKVAPGALPVTGRDLAAFTAFRGPTFYGLDGVFADIATGKLAGLKAPPPASEQERGSNAVAVAPRRSADGHTRVLFNSHQPWTGPLSWYEVVVESGEGWHIAGAVFPGAPFLLGGHNAHLGWAATVNHPDLADVYRLTVNPQNPDEYRLDGRWVPFDKRTAAIQVKGAAGAPTTTVTREILHSEHGPALRTPNGVFAVRYPTSGGLRQLQEYRAMNKARSMGEWKAALAMRALPSINYVYGDERGNIGYVSNGIYPVRKEGFDWRGILPGDRSDLIWHDVRPFSQSPQIWNPKSGFLFNSNNTPFRATDGSDDLNPADYPASMGIQPLDDMTNRGWRAIETFGADKKISPEAFDRYKYDLAYSDHSDERAWVKAILAADPSDPVVAAAQPVLRAWDGRTDLENRGAALIAVMWLQKRQHPDWTPLQMLKGSAPLIKAAYGRLDPKWGEVNRLRRGKLDLPLDGGPDTFRAIYGRPDPDGRLHGVNGDCYIMWMDWDRNGRLSSKSIHQFGSATLDESSPHYADQSPLFATRRTKPVWFTEAELKGHVERDYRPGETTGSH